MTHAIGLNSRVRHRSTEQAPPSGHRGLPQVSHLDGNQEALATKTAHDSSSELLYNTLLKVACQIRHAYMESAEPRWDEYHHASPLNAHDLIMTEPVPLQTSTPWTDDSMTRY